MGRQSEESGTSCTVSALFWGSTAVDALRHDTRKRHVEVSVSDRPLPAPMRHSLTYGYRPVGLLRVSQSGDARYFATIANAAMCPHLLPRRSQGQLAIPHQPRRPRQQRPRRADALPIPHGAGAGELRQRGRRRERGKAGVASSPLPSLARRREQQRGRGRGVGAGAGGDKA